MNEETINKDSRVIGRCHDLLLITNNKSADFSTINEYGFIINGNGEIVSPYAKIGFLTKFDYWEPLDIKYSDYHSSKI